MRRKTLVITIFLALFSGCTSGVKLNSVTPEVVSQPITTFVQEETPDRTHSTSTVSPTLSTFSATITPISLPVTATPEPFGFLPCSYLDILSELPSNVTYPGKLILAQSSSGNYSYSLFNLNNHEMTSVPDASTITISDNRKKYAFRDKHDDLVKIFSSDGSLLSTITVEKENLLDQWIGNKKLIFVTKKSLEGMNDYVYPPDVLLIDTTTKERKVMPSKYPKIDEAQAGMFQWVGGSITKYNSDLTRVVYFGSIEKDYQGFSGPGYILYDLVDKKILAEMIAYDPILTPKWSPDGSKFVASYGNGEVTIVTSDGQVTQLTHFNSDPQNRGSGITYFGEVYSWSPDNRHLVFWLTALDRNGSLSSTFVLLDTVSGDLTQLCIPIDFSETGIPTLPGSFTPIWSPDGKYFVVKANNQENGEFDLFLVDISEKYAAKIDGKGFIATGWLETGP